MSKRVTTNDPVTAHKWAVAFHARKPITIEGKEYLLLELTTVSGFHPVFPFSGASALAEDYVITGAPGMSAFRAKEALNVDLSNPPASATHYHPQDEKHPFRKKVNGVCFAWVETWYPVSSSGAYLKWEPLPTGPSVADMAADSIDGKLLGDNWPLMPRCTTVPLNFNLSGTVTGRDESTAEAPKPEVEYWAATAARCAIKAGEELHEAIMRAAYPQYRIVRRHDESTAEAPKPQWDGTGLPPVGVDVEVLWSSLTKAYDNATVVGHDEGRAVFRFNSGERAGEYQAEEPATYYSGTLPNFRPTKTAEQLEAEKRAAEIERMVGTCTAGCHAPTVRRKVCENLYDAGLRFDQDK